MHILVLGAAGMVGRKLIERLARDGALGGKPITEVTAADVVEPEAAAASRDGPFRVRSVVGDFSAPGEAGELVAGRPDMMFHLAVIVSAEAEADFDKGYRIILDGTRRLFEAVRGIGEGYAPRLVFTSSIAVFGAPFPKAIDDAFL